MWERPLVPRRHECSRQRMDRAKQFAERERSGMGLCAYVQATCAVYVIKCDGCTENEGIWHRGDEWGQLGLGDCQFQGLSCWASHCTIGKCRRAV